MAIAALLAAVLQEQLHAMAWHGVDVRCGFRWAWQAAATSQQGKA